MEEQYVISADDVSKRIGSYEILRQVDLAIRPGECFGIIGPNGSGKSTLVKLLSGAEELSGGDVRFMGKPLASYTRKQLARQIAVLQQEALPPVGFTVREVVEMGRYPYQNWLGEEGAREAAELLIDDILRELDLLHLADRSVDNLSGGERQRAALAKAAAQQPSLLMLDEPTTYLDIGYQQQMMDYIKHWQRSGNLTVLAVLHDLNLAALYCDRILILHEGSVASIGSPDEILRADILEQVYGVRPVIIGHPTTGAPQVLLHADGTSHTERGAARTEQRG